MQSFVTGDDLYAHVLLLRAVDPRAVLLMEGPSDCAVVDPHLNSDQIQSLPAHGKESLLRCIEIADIQGERNVLGVADRDFDIEFGFQVVSKNLVYTDAYDMDTLVCYTGSVLSRAISAASHRETRIRHLTAHAISDPRTIVECSAGALSAVRFLSMRDGLGLNLDRFPMHAVVKPPSGEVDLERMIDIAISRSSQTVATRSRIVAEVESIRDKHSKALRYFIRGHDFHACLAVQISQFWGGTKLSVERIAVVLRAAMGCLDLMGTTLFDQIRTWGHTRGINVWSCPKCI